MNVRAYALTVILVIFAIATAVNLTGKPIEVPLQADEHGSGAWQPIDEPDAKPANWPTNAAAGRLVWSDQYACMRLMKPIHLTTEPRGVVRT